MSTALSTRPGGALIVPCRRRVVDRLPEAAVPLLLVVVFVLFSVLSPHNFFTWANVKITLAAQATVVLLAIAITIPLRAGDFDLAIPAAMIMGASGTGLLYAHGVPTAWCWVAGIVIGCGIGAVNATLIVGFGLDGLVVTLGMFTLLGGITSWLTGGKLITTIPPGVISFATADFLGLQSVVWIGWAVAPVVRLALLVAAPGRHLPLLRGPPSDPRPSSLPARRLPHGLDVTAPLLGGSARRLRA